MPGVTVLGHNIAIVLDEVLEDEGRMEGQLKSGLYIIRSKERKVLPMMRVGTIISIGPGKWMEVDDVLKRVTVPPSVFRVGMKVCLPPSNLTELPIAGVGNVVFTNPHGIIGEVVG